jgi:hypothetical protein
VTRRARWLHTALACVVGLGAACGPGESPPQSERPGAASPSTGPLDALSRRFGRVRSALRSRGYQEVRGLPRGFAVEGSGVAVALDFPTGRCSTVAALGGGGLRELRLTLYDGNGDEVAVDGVEGEGGLVHVCPHGPHLTAPHHLVLEAREGSGAIVSAVFDSAPEEGEGFEGVFDGVLAPSVPFRDVEERLAQVRSVLRERGLVPLGDPMLEVVAEGEVLRAPMELEAGRCYVVVARGGEGLEDVDLFLYDPAGAEVARNLESDAEPSLEHCPEQTGRHLFEVRAFEGAGAVGLMVATGSLRDEDDPAADGGVEPDPGQAAEDEREGSTGSVALSVTAALRSRDYEPVLVLREITLMPGEVRSHELLIGPGCHVVVGAATHPGMDLDLYLTDAQGVPVDQDARVEAAARVSACPPEPTLLQVKVKAYGREAPYVLTVMRAPPHVETVRDLRLDEADATLRSRGYERRRDTVVTLARGEPFTQSLKLAAGRCLAVAAAGDRSVHDLDLFLRAPDGRLVASESGPAPWGAVSRCASEDETLELEVLMYRGGGEVRLVWLERTPEPE